MFSDAVEQAGEGLLRMKIIISEAYAEFLMHGAEKLDGIETVEAEANDGREGVSSGGSMRQAAAQAFEGSVRSGGSHGVGLVVD